jgi:hypothetical protein
VRDREIRRSGVSFKDDGAKHLAKKPFVVTPQALGLPPSLNYDNVEELIEALEGSLHR